MNINPRLTPKDRANPQDWTNFICHGLLHYSNLGIDGLSGAFKHWVKNKQAFYAWGNIDKRQRKMSVFYFVGEYLSKLHRNGDEYWAVEIVKYFAQQVGLVVH